MSKRVWILGAGFSRPLGGPLLHELMQPEVRNRLEACFPRWEYGNVLDDWHDTVLGLYAYGSRYRDGGTFPTRRDPGELIWADAEQFLDYLDTADAGGKNSPAFQQLDRILAVLAPKHQPSKHLGTEGVRHLSQAAKRLVAGSCSAFLVGADPSTERWEPFVKWAQQLNTNDTIITFNYDCVLELLNRRAKTISVVGLGEGNKAFPTARLLKLHGSVNWKASGFRGGLPSGKEVVGIEQQDDFNFALKCSANELSIASPGPLKRAVSAGWLAELWDSAMEAIREASSIIFIGYRFPPSDSHARSRLLGAISENRSHYLAIHTVLGLASADTPRLSQLLRFSLSGRRPLPLHYSPTTVEFPTYTLVDHPLYGEDFLSVAPMDLIMNPWETRHQSRG